VQLGPLRRTGGPLNHAVYDLLKERLLEGDYAAGTRLPTDDLRLQLGVSKQPVMEALRRLSADGMIEIVPQVGCLVTGYDLHEIEDFYLGFGGFVRSCGYRLWNRRFHHAIVAMAQSRVMTETSRRMWDLSDFLINTAGLPQPLSSALDHRHADHERSAPRCTQATTRRRAKRWSGTSSRLQRSSRPRRIRPAGAADRGSRRTGRASATAAVGSRRAVTLSG